MNDFKSFNIKPETKSFEGDKIKIDRILNKNVTVIDFKIEESKYKEKGNGKCLYIQIESEGSKRVLFSGSSYLMDMIQKVPREGFPFTTTIVKNNEHLEFT